MPDDLQDLPRDPDWDDVPRGLAELEGSIVWVDLADGRLLPGELVVNPVLYATTRRVREDYAAGVE